MPSIGAIVVGIGTYRYDRDEYPPLNYASNDASEVAQYLSACWPKPGEAKLLHLLDEEATLEALTRAFGKLAIEGPYDLQMIFLSGHGLADSQNTGFVMQPSPGSSGLCLLDPARLDELLTAVAAQQTILILDCCHAEGITSRMEFFRRLGESDARLFIASSRMQQLTWEDERIGHGIFTAHLLDLLRTGSSVKLIGVRDQLDVDGELFPILCDQVPLYVLEHKQHRQEPVKGGVSIRSVRLPVARATRRMRERTAWGTAIRRVRQIGVTTAMVSVIFVCLTYILVYYAEADRSGNIQLNHGTKWLAPALRYFPTSRADTGISPSDLSSSPAERYAVQSGETWGIWTQLSRQGYRAWYDSIHASLDSGAATRYDVLLGTDGPHPVDRLKDESRPSEVALAAWALLDNSDSAQLSALFRHVLGEDQTSPLLTEFAPNRMDFDILDRRQADLAMFAEALESAATVDPAATFTPYLGFLKATQMWLTHSSVEQHGREAQRMAADDVAHVLAVIAKARADRGQTPLAPEMTSLLRQLAKLGYSDLVDLALSRSAAVPEDTKVITSRALAMFHGYSNEPAEAAALQGLKDLLDSSVDSQAIVNEVYKRFVAANGPEQSDLTAFLIAAADRKAIPATVMTILLDKMRDALVRHDDTFMNTEYARILAHAMSQVPVESQPLVYRLIEKVAAGVTPLSTSTAEMYTVLARQGLDTPAMFQQIQSLASAATPYQPQNPNATVEGLPGMSIVVGHGPWIEALAVAGANRSLPAESIRVLENHANDPLFRMPIIHALVHQPTWLKPQCWKSSCSHVLAAFAGDSRRRQLASDVLAEQLVSLPRAEFLGALERLRKDRATETEPEIRIALGLTAINAQKARVRIPRVGSELF